MRQGFFKPEYEITRMKNLEQSMSLRRVMQQLIDTLKVAIDCSRTSVLSMASQDMITLYFISGSWFRLVAATYLSTAFYGLGQFTPQGH